MSIASHIESIATKRSNIKQEIATEMALPSPDFTRIHELKKRNLLLKEEMVRQYKKQGYKASA